jgi:hypothetical protein
MAGESDKTGLKSQLLSKSSLPGAGKLAGAYSLTSLEKSVAAAGAKTSGASGSGGGTENAVVWDLSSGTKVAGYSRVISAAWWASTPSLEPSGPSHIREDAQSYHLALATPEFVQVLPAPKTSKQSASNRVGSIMQSLSRESKGAGSSTGKYQGQALAAAKADDADAHVVRGYYCVDKVDQLSIGTGDPQWLSYAVSDGAQVKMYCLQMHDQETPSEASASSSVQAEQLRPQ